MVKKAVKKLYLGNQEVNLATSGVTPSGTIDITENGTYDVTTYASANVTAEPTHYIPLSTDANGVLVKGETGRKINLQGVTDIGYRGLYYALYGATGITGSPIVNTESLENITGRSAMEEAFAFSTITELDLSGVKTVGVNDSTGSTDSQSRQLADMCENCELLEAVRFDNLEVIQGYYTMAYALEGCTALTTVTFPKLHSITAANASGTTGPIAYMFRGCVGLTDVYFPKLTTFQTGCMANHTFLNCNLPTVHFRIDADFKNATVIQSGFGGNATVVFDQGDYPIYIYVESNDYEVWASYDYGHNYTKLAFEYSSETQNYRAVCQGTGDDQAIDFMFVQQGNKVGWRILHFNETNNEAGIVFNAVRNTIIPQSNQSGATYTLTFENLPIVMTTTDGSGFYFDSDMGNNATLTGYYDGYQSLYPYTAQPPMDGDTQYWYVDIEVPIQEDSYSGDDLFMNLDPDMSGDPYWSTDSGALVIHPTVATTVTTNSAIQIEIPEGCTSAVFKLTYELGAENNYDFGYLALGPSLISRTAAQIKSGTIADGVYLFRETGSQTIQRTEQITVDASTGYLSGTQYITIGWGQDNSTSSFGNYFKIYSLEILYY